MTLAVKDATGATQNIPFPNSNGQAPMASSAPVVIASDQIVAVSASSLPLPAGAAADGSDGTGITPPVGGVGIRGWLSGIYGKLSNPLAVTGTFWQATQPVSGSVSISGTPGVTIAGGSIANSSFAISGQLPSFAAAPTVNLGTLGGAAQDGSDGTGITAPTGGAGIRGWLSGIYSKLSNPLAVTGTFWPVTQPVSGTVTANIGTIATLAQDGTDASGVTMPSGGAGIRGWLSAIYNKLNSSVAVTGTVSSPLPSAMTVNQQMVTGSAAALATLACQNGFVLLSHPSNTGTIYFGGSGVTAATGYPLSPGQSFPFPVSNANTISIIGTVSTDIAIVAGN